MPTGTVAILKESLPSMGKKKIFGLQCRYAGLLFDDIFHLL
jgi:hypothetical protein